MWGPVDLVQYLIVGLIFIQVEMYFPLRANQKLFRRHWRNDLVFLLLNGIVIQLGLAAAIAGLIAAVRWAMPHAVGAAVQSQPSGCR